MKKWLRKTTLDIVIFFFFKCRSPKQVCYVIIQRFYDITEYIPCAVHDILMTYFIAGSLNLLIPFTYFTCPACHPCPDTSPDW